MSLYDLIYSFFLTRVFLTNEGEYEYYLEDLSFKINSEGTLITLQSWLCHTATIISITIIVVLCCMFVYKIVRLIGGLIR